MSTHYWNEVLQKPEDSCFIKAKIAKRNAWYSTGKDDIKRK